MAQTVTNDNTSLYEGFQYSTEASTLALPPGVFPERLETTMGNKQPFLRQTLTAEKAVYKQGNGLLVLTVYND